MEGKGEDSFEGRARHCMEGEGEPGRDECICVCALQACLIQQSARAYHKVGREQGVYLSRSISSRICVIVMEDIKAEGKALLASLSYSQAIVHWRRAGSHSRPSAGLG